MRAEGAMSAPFPYCRPSAIATSSTVRISTQLTVHGDRGLVPRACEDLIAGDLEIASEAAARQPGGGKLMRDARVEADAGKIEEEPALDLASIDHSFVSAKRDCKGRL